MTQQGHQRVCDYIQYFTLPPPPDLKGVLLRDHERVMGGWRPKEPTGVRLSDRVRGRVRVGSGSTRGVGVGSYCGTKFWADCSAVSCDVWGVAGIRLTVGGGGGIPGPAG